MVGWLVVAGVLVRRLEAGGRNGDCWMLEWKGVVRVGGCLVVVRVDCGPWVWGVIAQHNIACYANIPYHTIACIT